MKREAACIFLLCLAIVSAAEYSKDSGKEVSTEPSYDITKASYECKEGDTKCVGAVFEACKAGSWVEVEKCAGGCSPSGCSYAPHIETIPPSAISAPVRPACTNDQGRCSGQNFQICQFGTWQTMVTCGRAETCTSSGCVSNPPLTQLACPTYSRTSVKLPAPPYNLRIGDCALRRQSGQIEQYLGELEAIANNCRTRVAERWREVLASPENISYQIGLLPSSDIILRTTCERIMPTEPSRGIERDEEGWQYTNWLRRIAERVVEYCKNVDELIRPVVDSCENMNEEIDCIIRGNGGLSESERASLRWRLDGAMNLARLRHDNLETFYNNALMESGWGNFRAYFNEIHIQCKEKTRTAPVVQTITTPPPQPRSWFRAIFAWLFGK